jgi:hypothetical protein
MQVNHPPPDDYLQNAPSKTGKDWLRRFLTWMILVGVLFNIMSWGGAAGFLVLRQSGVSIDWGGIGRLPNIQLGLPDVQQTIPPNATLPPTPIDITSIGQPSNPQLSPTPTATEPAERTPGGGSDVPPAASTP